jgi:curved DNA-binding protein
MDDRDYYAALGVKPDAAAADIKKAYRRLARKYHPDVSKETDAAKKMAVVNEAYNVLSDAQHRAEYDEARAAALRRASTGAHRDPRGTSDEAPGGFGFRGFASGGGEANVDEADFSDVLNEMFRRGGGSDAGFAGGAFRGARAGSAHAKAAAGGPVRGEDQHGDIAVEIADSFTGATRRLSLNLPEWSEDGRIGMRQRTLDVAIPKGIKPGQMIRLAGQGSPGFGGGAAGDLYLRVHFAPDSRFVWDGENLVAVLPVAPWEAALGAVVPVSLPNGGQVKVRVPQGAQSGQSLIVRGKGLPSATPGDLELKLHVVLPSGYEPRAKAIYEEMAKALPDFDARMVHAAEQGRGQEKPK